MELIIFGLILWYVGKKGAELSSKGPSDPYLGSRYEVIHVEPSVQHLIDKYGVDHKNSGRRISANNNRRYNGL